MLFKKPSSKTEFKINLPACNHGKYYLHSLKNTTKHLNFISFCLKFKLNWLILEAKIIS